MKIIGKDAVANVGQSIALGIDAFSTTSFWEAAGLTDRESIRKDMELWNRCFIDSNAERLAKGWKPIEAKMFDPEKDSAAIAEEIRKRSSV